MGERSSPACADATWAVLCNAFGVKNRGFLQTMSGPFIGSRLSLWTHETEKGVTHFCLLATFLSLARNCHETGALQHHLPGTLVPRRGLDAPRPDHPGQTIWL